MNVRKDICRVSLQRGRVSTRPPVSYVRVRELMLLMGGESEDKNARRGEITHGQGYEHRIFLSEYWPHCDDKHAYFCKSHLFATQTNLFVALDLCRPLIPLNTQLGARQLGPTELAKIFSQHYIYNLCLHNIWKQRYLRTEIVTKRSKVYHISPKKYSHDAGWTKIIVVAQEGHIPDDQRGGVKIVTSPPCPRVLAS